MTGGDSIASSTGIDALLLDFMRVVSSQHRLFYSTGMDSSNASVRMDLRHTANLFHSLGLTKQSTGTQWMLIIKLYRLQCLKEINFHYNGGGDWDAEGFFNFQFDYGVMDNEVELVLVPDNFEKTLKRLEQSLAVSVKNPTAKFTCKMYIRDNRVFLAIDDVSFQVAKPSSGSMIERLLLDLQRRPSLDILSAIDFQPNDSKFSFVRLIDKYKYRWLIPLLPVYEAKVISIQNPTELDLNQLLSMLPEIAEIYRQPLAHYLGIERSIDE